MARDFNGTDGEITIADNAIWDGLGAITVSAWCLSDVIGTVGGIFTRWGAGGAQSWYLGVSVTTANRAEFATIATATFRIAVDTTNLNTTDWIHLAGSWTSAGPTRIWRNGVNTASSANSTGTMVNSTVQPTLGNSRETANFYNGKLAEVAIWNVELTTGEIGSLAKGFSPALIRPQSRLAHWPLLGNLSPEPDVWRNNLPGTIAGTVAKFPHPRIIMPSRRAA